MGPIQQTYRTGPTCRGYVYSVADAQGVSRPISAVFEQADGRFTICPLPPPEPPYIQHKPTITFLWDDPRKGPCYRLNFGRKEIFVTLTELLFLKALLDEPTSCPNKQTAKARTPEPART
jgi:hypothetical protein